MKQAIKSCLMIIALYLVACDTANTVEPFSDNYFIKYYGDSGNQQGVDLLLKDDGNIVLLGNSVRESSHKFFLVELNPAGEIIRQKNFGTANAGDHEIAVDLEPGYDGTYIIAVQFKAAADTENDVKLLKVSPTFQGLDSVLHIFSDDGDELIKSVTTLRNNPRGFLLTGSTTSDLANDGLDDVTDAFAFRTDENFVFNASWKSLGGGGKNENGVRIFERDSPGNFVLFFSTNPSSTGGDSDFKAIFINDDGSGNGLFLEVSEENTTNEILSDVSDDPIAGYILVGTSTESESVYQAIIGDNIAKPLTNIENLFISEQTSGIIQRGALQGISCGPSKFGGYFIVATQQVLDVDNPDNSNLVLIKLNSVGAVVWSNSFGAEFKDQAAKVLELADGKILVLGTVTLNNQEKMALIKVNRNGQFGN